MADINVRSQYFQSQFSRNTLIRDLIKGLDALRGFNASAVTTSSIQQSVYLPRFPEEPQPVYEQRVKRSYLTNYFSRAIDSDSGKILAKPIGIKANQSDLPETFWPWLDDTDLEGKAFSVLARDQLKAACAKGATIAFVDHTAISESGIKGRPFVREIDIDNVLAFKADQTTGKLTFLRWQDSIPTESEDEGIINANVVFELEPTEWRMYRIDDNNEFDEPDDMGAIVRYRNGSQLITDELPVSLFYTNKTGKLTAESPYRTLAELTLEHFQVYSDMKNMLFYALQPILMVQNAPQEFMDSAGFSSLASYICLKFPAEANPTDVKWIQVDAAPIEQARAQLDDIQQRIASFSIDNSAIKPGNQTATQSAIDASGANAALRSFAEGLEEHMERIIEIMASYTVMPEIDIDVTITPDFSVKDNNENIKLAQEDVKNGRITIDLYLDVAIENGLYPEDLDKEKMIEQLQEQIAASAFE